MDPHISEEDAAFLQYGHHRRLRQHIAPLSPVKSKKKKLVNFMVSSMKHSMERESNERRGSTASTGSVYTSTDIPLHELDNNNWDEIPRTMTRRDLDERDYNRNFQDHGSDRKYFGESSDEYRNLNNQRKDKRSVKERREDFKRVHERRSDSRIISERRDGILHIGEAPKTEMRNLNENTSNLSIPKDETLQMYSSKKDKNGNPPASNGPRRLSVTVDTNPHIIPDEDSHRTMLNKSSSSTTSENSKTNYRRRNSSSTISQCFNQSASWDLVRELTVPEERENKNKDKGKFGSVVELAATKRRTSMAPTIWTPAVPRTPPAPRPANFMDKEKPGRRTFIITFITRSKIPRQKSLSHRCQKPAAANLYRVPTEHWERSGKQYMAWIADLVANPLLQEGQLLKGLEIGD